MTYCPNCRKTYTPELTWPEGDNRHIQEIFPNAPAWQREQLISGICSDKCWDEFLGVKLKEE